MEKKLSLWSLGVVVTILSPIVSAMSESHFYNSGPDWNYIKYFLLVLWGLIGCVYLYENKILKREIEF